MFQCLTYPSDTGHVISSTFANLNFNCLNIFDQFLETSETSPLGIAHDDFVQFVRKASNLADIDCASNELVF